MKVGFIGLGIMGSRMAANLLAEGYELVVWNRTVERVTPLVEKGALRAESPAALAAEVDVLFTMLAHPEAVQQTALGMNGFLDALPAGALWVDSSTVNPSFSREMAQAAVDRGVRFVDAPVAGTKGPAAEGALLFLAGGSEADVEECRPFFEIMGRKTVHVGDVSMGTSLKMVVNLLLAEAMLAFAEGMALGQALGIERDTLFEVLVGGPVVAPFIKGKQPVIEEGEYEAHFPLKWMEKDLHLAAVTAHEEEVAIPAGAVTKETFALAARKGLGELDFSAIYRFINEVATGS